MLFDKKYKNFIDKSPVFFRGETKKLRKFIKSKIYKGDNGKVIDFIEKTNPSIVRLLSPKIYDITKKGEYVQLIDDQELVYEKALEMTKKCMNDNRKRVLIVKGGPGTGKSVLALKILVDIFENPSSKIEKASYITPIQAQRKIYQYIIKKNNMDKNIKENIKSSSSYVKAIENENDILIIDEAHRLKEKSGMFNNIGENQTKEIINASKFSIFFIDDAQRVAMEDKGGREDIIEKAKEQNAVIEEYELTSQFRCLGSASYVSWVEDVLQMKNTANHDGFDDDLHYDIRVVDNPNEMRKIIRIKNRKNNASRIVAGYCWESKKESRDNPNIMDIEIPKYKFKMSWNLSNENWAIAEGAVERAGCIYTCQGLDFDYIGVIIGPDLICRNGKLITDRSKRAKTDGAFRGIGKILEKNKEYGEKLIDEIIKNTYRILLTRGRCRMHYILRR